MYDKFHCRITDFEIERNPVLVIERLPFNSRTGAVKEGAFRNGIELTVNGKTNTYKKAYNNHGTSNITIDKSGLMINFNPSKTGKNSNFETADAEQLERTIKKVKADLKAYGIKCNLDNADISRLDLSRNYETKYKPGIYTKILNELPGVRIPPKALYPSGVMLGNTQRNIIGYDKILSMMKLLIDLSLYNLNENSKILRLEYQLLNKRAVENTINGTWKLKGFTSPDLFNHCKETYKQGLKKQLFKTEINNIETVGNSAGLDEFYKYLYLQVKNSGYSPGKALSITLKLIGVKTLMDYTSSEIIDKIDPVISEYCTTDGAKRKMKSTLKSEVVKQQQEIWNLEKTEIFPGATKKKLYREIRNKVLKSA